MKRFEDFQLEKEKHEVATLICDLGIDPDAYFEQVLSEGIFKKMGDWWKKNVTAGNKVRLQSSYDQALQAIGNFVTNYKTLHKQGLVRGHTPAIMAVAKIKANLEGLKDQVAAADQQGQQGAIDTPYADVGSWDGKSADPMGAAKRGWDNTKPARNAIGAKFGDMKKSWDDWRSSRSGSDPTYTGGGGI
jgi:hypothetical protein